MASEAKNNAAALTFMADGDIPDGFICPITTELMTDPVVAADGHTYERSSIETWFQQCGDAPKSPLTNVVLPSAMLIPNHALRKAIAELTARQNGTAPPAPVAASAPPQRLVIRSEQKGGGGDGGGGPDSPAPSAPPMDEHFLDDAARGDASEGKRAGILGAATPRFL